MYAIILTNPILEEMNTPIIDPSTLTDEQRDAIRKKLQKATITYPGQHPFLAAIGVGWKDAFVYFRRGVFQERRMI